jgi:hypothetical protein
MRYSPCRIISKSLDPLANNFHASLLVPSLNLGRTSIQIVGMLRQLGMKPPAAEILFYYYEQSGASRQLARFGAPSMITVATAPSAEPKPKSTNCVPINGASCFWRFAIPG